MENTAWNLEDFVDSLVVELDKTRETLAIKAINKPLTYTVKDLAMDLNIFPTYDGDQIRFVTAQPGEQGASKVTIQLGSITDQQVRATSKAFAQKNDVKISDIDVDKKTKKQLRKMGVTSAEDLQQIENKNVNIEKTDNNDIDYTKLANQIQKAKRNSRPPIIKSVSLSMTDDNVPYLIVKGEHLAVNALFKPVAVINSLLADVTAHSEEEIKIKLTKEHNINGNNNLIVTLDPYAIVKLNVNI
jgi:hypothetical protein